VQNKIFSNINECPPFSNPRRTNPGGGKEVILSYFPSKKTYSWKSFYKKPHLD